MLVALLVDPLCGTDVPFHSDVVAKCGASLASELAPSYLPRVGGAIPDLITLEDEIAWSCNQHDVVKHKKILFIILQFCQSCVPSVLFLALVILAADSILDFKVVNKDRIAAFK